MSNAATGYVAKISMLRLNIGSGKLSSCMLSIGRGPKAVQGKGGGCPPLPCSHLGPRPTLSSHELSLGMPELMLSLSMQILATCPEHAQECSEHCSARWDRSACSERSWPREQCSRPTQSSGHGHTLAMTLTIANLVGMTKVMALAVVIASALC